VVDTYQTALQQRNETDLLRRLYSNLSRVDDASASYHPEAWLAYLDIREGKGETARELFLNSSVQPDEGVAYYLQQMALCRIHMATEAFRQAIDHSARVIALGTIEDVLYPEALYISALCYDGLAEQEQARLEAERKEAVQKALIQERVRVALELEARADEAGAPPPSEQDILDALDMEVVESRVPPVPPIEENNFALIAQRLYLFNDQVFPSTTWGQTAGEQVWPQTRNNKERDLTNYIPPELPN